MDKREFLVDEECTMLEAMSILDKGAKKVLFVTRKKQFKAAITDGDIRRWILKKGDLDAKIKEIANYNPKFLYLQDEYLAKEFMTKHLIDAIPILNKDGEIISISFLRDTEIKKDKNIEVPVVIMAGGLGTRLYPYTKILPKSLIPIGEIPIVEHIINRYNKSISSNFFLVVNHKKNMIKAYFNEIERGYSISYVEEDKPLDTGGGLSLLKGKIDKTFVLSNCDILIEEDYEKIYEFHKAEKNLITMVCSLKNIQIPYGVVEINSNGEIDEMKEKPKMSFFINTGVYIVEPKVIDELEYNTCIGFPDIIEFHRSNGEKIGIYPISENAWMDMGQIDQMEDMKRRLKCDE